MFAEPIETLMIHVNTAIVGIALVTSVLTQESSQGTAAAALQGTWLISSLNGQSVPEGAPEVTVTFTGDKYHQAIGGEMNERGTIKMDASKKPITIDFVISEGDDAGKTQLGLIEVSGDAMRASLGTPGAAQRPTDFSFKDGVIVLVGKKIQR